LVSFEGNQVRAVLATNKEVGGFFSWEKFAEWMVTLQDVSWQLHAMKPFAQEKGLFVSEGLAKQSIIRAVAGFAFAEN